MPGDFFFVDSDTLLTAHRRYYSFDICPGFWNNLINHHEREKIFSINHVRQELLRGDDKDDLFQWVSNKLPPSFFLEENSTEVVLVYKRIVKWARGHSNYSDQAHANYMQTLLMHGT